MTNNHKYWHQCEVDFLIANMNDMKTCELVQKLGRSRNAIASKLKRIRSDGLINCRKKSSKYI